MRKHIFVLVLSIAALVSSPVFAKQSVSQLRKQVRHAYKQVKRYKRLSRYNPGYRKLYRSWLKKNRALARQYRAAKRAARKTRSSKRRVRKTRRSRRKVRRLRKKTRRSPRRIKKRRVRKAHPRFPRYKRRTIKLPRLRTMVARKKVKRGASDAYLRKIRNMFR